MFVCCECCVLSGRGLCDGLFTRPEKSYRLWCVVVCDLETSWMRKLWPNGGGGYCAKNKQINIIQQDRQCICNVTLRSVRATLLQWKSNTYYTALVCVFVALDLQHAVCVRRIVICGLPCSTIPLNFIS